MANALLAVKLRLNKVIRASIFCHWARIHGIPHRRPWTKKAEFSRTELLCVQKEMEPKHGNMKWSTERWFMRTKYCVVKIHLQGRSGLHYHINDQVAKLALWSYFRVEGFVYWQLYQLSTLCMWNPHEQCWPFWRLWTASWTKGEAAGFGAQLLVINVSTFCVKIWILLCFDEPLRITSNKLTSLIFFFFFSTLSLKSRSTNFYRTV